MTREEALNVARPILFNTDMVRAILAGKKTVTRRVVKPQPVSKPSFVIAGHKSGTWAYPNKDAWKYWEDEDYRLPDNLTEDEASRHWTPPCHHNDVLYVRETWSFASCSGMCDNACDTEAPDFYLGEEGCFVYKANYGETADDSFPPSMFRWHPSIHMPKDAARIFLRVTDVRLGRLQEVGDEQAEKEGCFGYRTEGKFVVSPTLHFMETWDATIKKGDLDKYGWEANPWVWVIEFEVMKGERSGWTRRF